MKHFRYWFRLISVFLGRFKGLIVIGTLIGILTFSFLPRITSFFALLTNAQRIALVGRFTLEELPHFIQSEISPGLTVIDGELNVQPGLALEWSAQEQGRVWVFNLGDFKWQNGESIKAQHINYNFADVETEVTDEKTIKFILKDPFAPFPSVVARPVFRKGLLGAGDWRVEKLTFAGGRFVETLRLRNKENGSLKVYKFYPTEEAARTAFKLGEVDVLSEIVDPTDLAGWPNARISENIREDRYVGVFINLNNPLLADKRLRQALAYGINKEKFQGERAISPISPKSWAFNPQVKQYTYSPGRAKELLQELTQRENLTVNLVVAPTLLSVADQIKEDWEAVGVKTNVQVSNSPPPDFQALVAIQAIPSDPDQYSLWHSQQQATNITNYGEQPEEQKPKESFRIDKLLEEGRRTLDQEERKAIYIDFQRFLAEDSPVIFLYYPITYTIIRK